MAPTYDRLYSFLAAASSFIPTTHPYSASNADAKATAPIYSAPLPPDNADAIMQNSKAAAETDANITDNLLSFETGFFATEYLRLFFIFTSM